MTVSKYAVLTAVVEAYGESGEPQRPAPIADSMGMSTETVEEVFGALCEYDLLRSVDGGVRPTVTAYELLDLDVDAADVLVIDPDGM